MVHQPRLQVQTVAGSSDTFRHNPEGLSLDQDVHGRACNQACAQLDCGRSFHRIGRHAKIHLTAVHRAGQAVRSQHFDGSPIHPHLHKRIDRGQRTGRKWLAGIDARTGRAKARREEGQRIARGRWLGRDDERKIAAVRYGRNSRRGHGDDARLPKVHQQITMGHAVNDVPSHDVAALIDRVGRGKGSAGQINRAELALAQQKAMAYPFGDVTSGNVAASVDPGRGSAGISRDVK